MLAPASAALLLFLAGCSVEDAESSPASTGTHSDIDTREENPQDSPVSQPQVPDASRQLTGPQFSESAVLADGTQTYIAHYSITTDSAAEDHTTEFDVQCDGTTLWTRSDFGEEKFEDDNAACADGAILLGEEPLLTDFMRRNYDTE